MNKVYKVRHIKPSVQKERSRRAIPLLIAGIIILATSGIFVPIHTTQAATAGPNNGSSFANDNSVGSINWSNPSYAQISGNLYAIADLDRNEVSRYLKATGFGFSIPVGATINGVEVNIERSQESGGNILDNSIRLVKGGSIVGSNYATSTRWGNSDTVITYGGSSNLWGVSLTRADVNSSNFGVVFSAKRDNTGDNHHREARIDHITIKVYYTSGPTTGTLHVVKVISGGSATPDNFSFQVNDGNPIPFEADGQNDLTVNAGSYSVTESVVASNYTASYDNCAQVVIPNGGEATCTITNTYATTGTISGRKFNDLNGNGTDNQEPALTGWTINLYSNDDPWTLVQSATTSQDGSYAFSNLTDGTYYVCEVPQQGWLQTEPTSHPGTRLCEGGEGTIGYSVLISGGQPVTEKNFGNWQPPTGSISGMKFSDLSLNQAKDQGEPGLPGWIINLYNASGYPWTPLSQTTTDQGGAYSFSSLSDGTYGVCEVPQSGWFQVAPTQGSGCEQEGTLGYSITVTGGNQPVDNDFGNVAAGHLVVHKVTYPTDTQTGFSVTAHSDGGWDSNPQTVVGGGTASWDVYPRIYNVTEDPINGWVMTSNTCSGLQIGTGQTVECTIENTKLGSITLTKYADPDGEFMIHVQGPNSYSNDEGMHNGSVATQSNLESGTYIISETVPTEWVGRQEVICSSQRQQVAESDGDIGFELAPGEGVSCIFNNTEYGAISGIKFEDMLADHTYDIGDGGLPNWTINLYQYNDGFGFLDSRTTDRTGVYSFGNLLPGRYLACEVPQQGWLQSYPWGVPDMTQCPIEGGDGYDFTLAAGNTIVGKDFGNWTNGNVSGIKFNDLDGDFLGPTEGDVEEPGLPGWTIEFRVLGEENPFTQVTTEQDGSYQLIGALQPGVSYEVREVMQDGWTPTMPNGQGRYTIEPMHSGWNIRYMDFGNRVTFIDPPVADPGSGTFQDPVDVTLSANAPIIRYTIGDSTNEAPTCDTGNLYTDPIHVTQDANLKAIACNQGGYGSSIISHNYVIGWPRSTGGSWFPEVLGESTTTEEEGGGAQGEIVTSNVTSTPPEEEGTGEVLGTQTCTEEYLTDYLWYGKSNDATQVEKLQSFMNEHMQSGLPVTGFFGNLTRGAVRGFQLKYSNEVLQPWIDIFGGTFEDTATGNVYKTTKWKINMLKCPALNLTLPLLP